MLSNAREGATAAVEKVGFISRELGENDTGLHTHTYNTVRT